MAPAPVPVPPKLDGSMAPGFGSGSPALQRGPLTLNAEENPLFGFPVVTLTFFQSYFVLLTLMQGAFPFSQKDINL